MPVRGAGRIIWFEGPGEVDGFAPSRGGLVVRGAYEVTVRFGKDAAEAAPWRRSLNNAKF
jgi:hypothetical protein